MAAEFACNPQVLQGIAQSLLELKKMARSIEQSADALLPLASPEASQVLMSSIEHSRSISDGVGSLYRAIAKEAMS